jgi:deoxyribodipyrimidine photo-lyase
LTDVPGIRLRRSNDAPVNPGGDFVLYWMIACRRVRWNFTVDRAVEWARELDRPLLILEALRCGYAWASDRLHGFILEGMAENARQLQKHNVYYYPYVERMEDEGKGLIASLAGRACVIVTDDFPAFFLPRMLSSAGPSLPVLVEQVDSNGLLPMRSPDRVFLTAYAFRRFIQKNLPSHLLERPKEDALKGSALKRLGSLPKEILGRWPAAPSDLLKGRPETLASLPIDHRVELVGRRGGSKAAREVLREFLKERLSSYAEKRNEPEEEGASGLSPYLHFGHISAHEIFDAVTRREDWFFDRLSPGATGKRRGWWGMSEASESFLDQLITWRELGFNMCWQRQDYDRYESLPDWSKKTLETHEGDKREYLYSMEEFESARTHDPLWNAAQMQLVREGRIHNYLRMLWGKKILEWSRTPRLALQYMIELNNKYALDGRDPNSYSGIFWILGRYDRAWGPERLVFGKIRYMSSKSTARKVHVRNYIKEYAP